MCPNFYQEKFDDFLGADGLKLGQETWRLFVDGKQQQNPTEKGWVNFELREPGCLHGMFQALAAQREKIHEDISLDLICDIHKMCTEQTQNLHRSVRAGTLRVNADVMLFGVTRYAFVDEEICGYEKPSSKQILDQEQWTKEIEAEISKVLSRKEPFSLFSYNPPRDKVLSNSLFKHKPPITQVTPNLAGDELKLACEYFINKYNKNMHQILTTCCEEKKDEVYSAQRSDVFLDEIINLITVLERLHLFPDGNGRTLCTVLLNRELIKYGYSPIILDNPNMFDGCSHETIKAQIKEGILRFNEIKNGNIPENYIKTTEIMGYYNAEKTSHYYYDPLKVLTTPIAWLNKLRTHMFNNEYRQAIVILDKLLQFSIVPENGDIDLEELERHRDMLKQILNTAGVDPTRVKEAIKQSSDETKQLFFYLKRFDELLIRMQGAQQASLTSHSILPSNPT